MTETLRRPGLGRGLAALLPPRASAAPADVPVDRVRPNPFQPRRRFDPAELEGLAASIAEHGVLQPIVVVEVDGGEAYQLIAGERRLRAAELAGLSRIPAIVREAGEHARLEIALVENIQRADLGPLDEAHAYRRLMDDFGLTQEEVARRVGRARSTVANTLRLLDLSPHAQEALDERAITEGHARALGTLPGREQEALLRTIVARGLSVRETEELARRLRETPLDRGAKPAPARRPADADLERVETDLRAALGRKVSLVSRRRGGRIVIEYYDTEDLDRLYERLMGVSE